MSDHSDRIQALLNKAADPATSQEEAESYLAKATFFMAKYNIEVAVTNEKEHKVNKTLSHLFYVVKPFTPHKVSLLSVIATSLGCQVIVKLSGAQNDGTAVCDVFGYENDMDTLSTLFVSAQLIAAHGSEYQRRQGHTDRGFHASYYAGFPVGIRSQLENSSETAKIEAQNSLNAIHPGSSSSVDIMLVTKELAVNDLVKKTYPRLRRLTRSYTNSTGFNAGKRDGASADITGKRRALT